MSRLIESSRFLFVLPSLALLVMSVVLAVFGAIETVIAVVDAVTAPSLESVPKDVVIAAVEVADLFLIATVLFIFSAGLFSLFVRELELPERLRVASIVHLERTLVGLLVVVMGVSFLGTLFRETDGRSVALTGLGVAAVIAALAVFYRWSDAD